MSNGGHYKRKNLERAKHTTPAMQRRLVRGAKKLAAKHARAIKRADRIVLHHQPLPEASRAMAEPALLSPARLPKIHATTLTKEHQA